MLEASKIFHSEVAMSTPELSRAERGIAEELIGQTVLDEVNGTSASIQFKRVYHQEKHEETNDLYYEMVKNKVLMVAEFSTGAVSETVLGDQYRFVPNNTILEIANRIGGASITVNHFGMYFFGSVTKDDLTAQIFNSYGGVRAFEMAPTIKLDNIDVPVFLKLRQVHSGGLETFEFRLRESLTVAKALSESKGEIEQLLTEPMTLLEAKTVEESLTKSRMPKKIVEQYTTRRNSLLDDKIESYKDVILFMVQTVKDYGLSKKFSVPLQIATDKLVSEILLTSKAAAKIKSATMSVDREEIMRDTQDYLKGQEEAPKKVSSGLKF